MSKGKHSLIGFTKVLVGVYAVTAYITAYRNIEYDHYLIGIIFIYIMISFLMFILFYRQKGNFNHLYSDSL